MGCESWRELIAATVFDDPEAAELVGLEAHLEGCADCRELTKELSATYAALELADPNAIRSAVAVPPNLTASVLGSLRQEGRAVQRRRVLAYALSAAACVAVVAVVLGSLFASSVPPRASASKTEILHGSGNLSAVAVLTAKSWGTSLDFRESGLPGRGQYTVSMRTADGTWWVAGTYRAVAGGAINATMACSVAVREITGVRVTSASGQLVLDSGNYPESGHAPAPQ
jgi:hypothetical protein